MRRLFTLFIAVISVATLASCAASKYDKDRAFSAATEAAGRIGETSGEYYEYVFYSDEDLLPDSTTVENDIASNGITLDNFVTPQGNIEKFAIVLSVNRTSAHLHVFIKPWNPDYYYLRNKPGESMYYDPATSSMNFKVYDANPKTGDITGAVAVTVVGSRTSLNITDSSAYGGPFTQNTPFLLTGVPAGSQAANTQSID